MAAPLACDADKSVVIIARPGSFASPPFDGFALQITYIHLQFVILHLA
ncbi:MAG: hypothetical protein V7642_1488 [Burkholderiales bacterium]|jgi:hypothetical protein